MFRNFLNLFSNLNVTFDKFIQAAQIGGDEGLTTVYCYIEQNLNNLAYLNTPNQDGDTALMLAVRYGHSEIVDALLGIQGIDIHAANQLGNTALSMAAYKGRISFVEKLLAKMDIEQITKKNHDHCSAAQVAVRNGYPEIAALIVSGIIDQLCATAHAKSVVLFQQKVSALVAASCSSEPKLTFKEQLDGVVDEEGLPQDLYCQFTCEVIEDPITPLCGITFDRKSLTNYFAKNGNPEELPWPEANGIPIKKSELSISTSRSFKKITQDCVTTQKEKSDKKASLLGSSTHQMDRFMEADEHKCDADSVRALFKEKKLAEEFLQYLDAILDVRQNPISVSSTSGNQKVRQVHSAINCLAFFASEAQKKSNHLDASSSQTSNSKRFS